MSKREWHPVDQGVAIFRRPTSKSWYINIEHERQRQQYSLKTADRQKALIIAREKASALIGGTWNVALAGSTIETAIEAYLSERCATRHAETTKKVTALVFGHFREWCRTQELEALDRMNARHVEAYLKWRQEAHDLTNPSVNRDLSWLKAWTRWCARRGMVRRDFTQSVEPLPIVHCMKWVPTPEQVVRVANECASPTLRDLVIFLLNTAARISDALSVTTKDIDFKEETILFRGQKTRTPYKVKHNTVTAEMLRRRALEAGGGFIFATGVGTRMDRHNVLHRLLEASKRAKVTPTLTPHAIRRSALTANAAVMPAFALQRLANHSSPATTAKFYVGRVSLAPVSIGG